MLASCGRPTEYDVQSGKPDARTMGLAATRNQSVFDDSNVGYSAFDDMSFAKQLVELKARFEIHMLTSAEAQTLCTQICKHYKHGAPLWWPAEPAFKASFFMEQYVVYLADNSTTRGFLMLRIQRGMIGLIPPFARQRAGATYAEDINRAAKVRIAMVANGIPVSESVVEQGVSHDEDRRKTLRLFSQRECSLKSGEASSLGAISLVITDDKNDDAITSIKQLLVPQSAIPCYQEVTGERRYVVDRTLLLRSVMNSPQGNLVILGLNYRFGENKMMWPGETLQSKYHWIYWCAESRACELVTQFTTTDEQRDLSWPGSRGKTTVMAVGLDEDSQAMLQEWSIDWGNPEQPANSVCDNIVARNTWRLAARAEQLANKTQRIRKAPLRRVYIKESKTYAYRSDADIKSNHPYIFLGSYSSGCNGRPVTNLLEFSPN